MELLEVDRRALAIADHVAPELGAAVEELAHQRAVEDLFEGAAEGGLDARDVVDVAAELLERLERRVVDVGDQRIAEPAEGLVDVEEIAVREGGGAAEERAAGAAAVARALPARREGVGEDGAERGAAGLVVAEAGRAPRGR